MIFQLPYVSFPENPPVHHMADYELFKPYLYSHHLKWSYGAIRGRPIDTWLNDISQLPASDMLKPLIHASFRGIYINRNGYEDHGAQLEKAISQQLGIQPFISQNQNLSFFDLKPLIITSLNYPHPLNK